MGDRLNSLQDLFVVKIGGNIIDNENNLASFLKQFAQLPAKKVLVHGGGKIATEFAEKLNIPQQVVEGRRITDHDTLKIVTMVYGGWINKGIVATLQSNDTNAIGLSGADGNLIRAVKRKKGSIDYGYVGDIIEVNTNLLCQLLDNEYVPVIAPLTHDGNGQLLNTNADTIAQSIALAVAARYKVSLIYSFEKTGVLKDISDEASLISKMNAADYKSLHEKGIIYAGMIPKLENAFTALHGGVNRVIIGKAENLNSLVNGSSGTAIQI